MCKGLKQVRMQEFVNLLNLFDIPGRGGGDGNHRFHFLSPFSFISPPLYTPLDTSSV